MAYCENQGFGDYEHGAFYYGLEPEAVKNLQKADVVILGNSHTLFSFSTDEVDRFFGEHGIRYFMLGFGYAEKSAFPLALLKRYQVHPKMLIINADPFFDPAPSQFDNILHNNLASRIKYRVKHAALRLSQWLCTGAPVICPRLDGAVYRSRVTGRWYWLNTLSPDKNLPFASGTYVDPAWIKTGVETAEQFLAQLPVRRECVVLTGIPGPNIDYPAIAASLAAKLHTPLINVVPVRMMSIDGSHMNVETAERWSRGFLKQFAPMMNHCL